MVQPTFVVNLLIPFASSTFMKQSQRKRTSRDRSRPTTESFNSVDTRVFADASASGTSQPDRKSAQLCAQIRRVLDFAVPEALAETEFDATVLEVTPAPNTSHLVVLLQSTYSMNDDARLQLQQEIVRKTGQIRATVAQSIHRRKTPSFTFLISPS